ncbi:MAG: DEAD/DEAH box helicase [Fimbriimonas sp.]|nr:DEAD/DEAH box helicase [Fimbriimonas sp.]
MSAPQNNVNNSFRSLNLSPSLIEILDRLEFTTPTPIQAMAIPVALEGRDVTGVAQTGTGKTLAFGLPILQHFQLKPGVALIIAPTRELAIQIDEVFQKVGRPLGFRTALLIGGAPMGRQVSQLKGRPHAIIATPGRLKDHLQQRTARLNHVSIVVLDEADRMLDMGFAPVIREILGQVTKERQTMLFSATMPCEIVEIAKNYMIDPVRIEAPRANVTADLVAQELYVVRHEDKGNLLSRLLDENKGSVLVFARTRHGARKVAHHVHTLGHPSAELHADRTLAQRRSALEGFKRGDYRVLVATDIAARGIDVKQISLVINYDLPDNPDDYVHRIGRTGRAGESGRAITLATPEQMNGIRDIERAIKNEIPLSENSELPRERQAPFARPTFGRGKGTPHQTGRPQISRGNHSYSQPQSGPRSGSKPKPMARR